MLQLRILCLAALLAPAVTLTAQLRNLEIYWVDVEGGAATLVIGPSGDSLLFDTGFQVAGDRDAKRIFAMAQHAALKKIDYRYKAR